MVTKLTDDEQEDIAYKIESEGFEYYFNSYGPDEKLKALCGEEITAFQNATKNLRQALKKNGIELEC